VYSGPDCHGSIYQDDGISFAFQQGEFLRQSFTCETEAGSVRVKLSAREGSWAPWWKQIEVVVYGWVTVSLKVTLNGQPVNKVRLDAAHGAVHVTIPEQGNGGELEFSAR
jgi:alpha-glucosidase